MSSTPSSLPLFFATQARYLEFVKDSRVGWSFFSTILGLRNPPPDLTLATVTARSGSSQSASLAHHVSKIELDSTGHVSPQPQKLVSWLLRYKRLWAKLTKFQTDLKQIPRQPKWISKTHSFCPPPVGQVCKIWGKA